MDTKREYIECLLEFSFLFLAIFTESSSAGDNKEWGLFHVRVNTSIAMPAATKEPGDTGDPGDQPPAFIELARCTRTEWLQFVRFLTGDGVIVRETHGEGGTVTA